MVAGSKIGSVADIVLALRVFETRTFKMFKSFSLYPCSARSLTVMDSDRG